jgi:superfamily II DNA or RNA helicase
MALRQDVTRLLIADDVGVGKTIEGALIARELLDRGDVTRIAVICPPYLCDQWQKELEEKFNIRAAVIRSGTIARLERQKPANVTLFRHNRHFVASIDLVKGEKYFASFIQDCPELVLVDEAHGAAEPPGGHGKRGQQQRHELLKELARNPNRHLILLTATPHSGVEGPFLSLLGLLKPEFRKLNLTQLSESERIELARHFVQRRRPDVQKWMGEETPFPNRSDAEETYQFSPEYLLFFKDVYAFASDLVRSAQTLTGWKRRMRFWSALALLRCVGSSPAAAKAALEKRAENEESNIPFAVLDTAADDGSTAEALDEAFRPVVYDVLDAEAPADSPPSVVFDAQEQDADWKESERRHLRRFARTAETLYGDSDRKLLTLVRTLTELLRDGYQPIVWCRFIATAEYVAAEVQRRLVPQFRDLSVAPVTGIVGDDERRLKVEQLAKSPRRILVATDCLSEGVNLQEHFTAVIHYDLPWNPNRLEQREGRVDRYGQTARTVKAVLMYGRDNRVDGAVLDVLLRKARDIYRDLGIHVPVPINSETVMEAVLQSLFFRTREDTGQLRLFDDAEVSRFHREWTDAADREKVSRTRFAQHAIKPEEVARELDAIDAVLGAPDAVRNFLLDTSQRLGFGLRKARNDVWELQSDQLPSAVSQRLADGAGARRITFTSPTPEGVAYVGRNHPLVEGLAEHLFDIALNPTRAEEPVARCGVIRTEQVARRTTLLLLRLRYLLTERGQDSPNLAEETLVWGYRRVPPDMEPLTSEASSLPFDSVKPSGPFIPPEEKREHLAEVLEGWDAIQAAFEPAFKERAYQLAESHGRVRSLIRERHVRIEPQTPPDLLGVLVLLPIPKGGTR